MSIILKAITSLASHPCGLGFGGNGEFTWFGYSIGYLFAMGDYNLPAIYDINGGTWHKLSTPHQNNDYTGHAIYDTVRNRLYFVAGDSAFYYQY